MKRWLLQFFILGSGGGGGTPSAGTDHERIVVGGAYRMTVSGVRRIIVS